MLPSSLFFWRNWCCKFLYISHQRHPETSLSFMGTTVCVKLNMSECRQREVCDHKDSKPFFSASTKQNVNRSYKNPSDKQLVTTTLIESKWYTKRQNQIWSMQGFVALVNLGLCVGLSVDTQITICICFLFFPNYSHLRLEGGAERGHKTTLEKRKRSLVSKV